jgi:hypothetical protein
LQVWFIGGNEEKKIAVAIVSAPVHMRVIAVKLEFGVLGGN